MVIKKVKNLAATFKKHFDISNPKFALCGLNPHAGEDGILGTEEIDILIPAVEELNSMGINITMPIHSKNLRRQ